jgi:hypothetical protein
VAIPSRHQRLIIDDPNVEAAGLAGKEIILRIRRASYQGGFRFVRDPATGALKIPADLEAEISKAFAREIRRMKFALDLRLALLYIAKLHLQYRAATLHAADHLFRYFGKLLGY